MILKDYYDSKFKIIFTTKDITEEQAEEIVENHRYTIKLTTYRDYMFLHGSSDYENEFPFAPTPKRTTLLSIFYQY